jgi:hypothetical protein
VSVYLSELRAVVLAEQPLPHLVDLTPQIS